MLVAFGGGALGVSLGKMAPHRLNLLVYAAMGALLAVTAFDILPDAKALLTWPLVPGGGCQRIRSVLGIRKICVACLPGLFSLCLRSSDHRTLGPEHASSDGGSGSAQRDGWAGGGRGGSNGWPSESGWSCLPFRFINCRKVWPWPCFCSEQATPVEAPCSGHSPLSPPRKLGHWSGFWVCAMFPWERWGWCSRMWGAASSTCS